MEQVSNPSPPSNSVHADLGYSPPPGESFASSWGLRRWLALLIVIIVLVVVLLVIVAVLANSYLTSDSETDGETRPNQYTDHWHSAYAVWDCADGENGHDENGEPVFKPVFESSRDERGVHSHQDGVIHIHPFVSSSSGKNANFDTFMSEMGLTEEAARIADDAIYMPDGTRLEEGVDCGGEPAIIQIARWHRLSQTDKEPVIYTENLGKVRFLANGEAFTVARAPEGAEIPPPPPERRDHARGLGPYSEINPNSATNPYDNPELYNFDEDGNLITTPEDETTTTTTITTAAEPAGLEQAGATVAHAAR